MRWEHDPIEWLEQRNIYAHGCCFKGEKKDIMMRYLMQRKKLAIQSTTFELYLFVFRVDHIRTVTCLKNAEDPTSWKKLLKTGSLFGTRNGLEQSRKQQVLEEEGADRPTGGINVVQKVTGNPSGEGEEDGDESSGINRNANLGESDALDDDGKKVRGIKTGPALEEELPNIVNASVSVLVGKDEARKREEIRQLSSPPTGEVVPQIVAGVAKEVVGDDVHRGEPANRLQDVEETPTLGTGTILAIDVG